MKGVQAYCICNDFSDKYSKLFVVCLEYSALIAHYLLLTKN